jgi:hypothetical protein
MPDYPLPFLSKAGFGFFLLAPHKISAFGEKANNKMDRSDVS